MHEGVSKMDASRNILIFNVTPIYSNERDFIYLFIYLLSSVNLGPQRRLWQSGQEENLWADPGGRESCWSSNPGGEGIFLE